MFNKLRGFLSPKPKTGEVTRQQARVMSLMVGMGASTYNGLGGFQRGSYITYRMMRTHPTLAMAKAAANAPIKAAGHSWESDDDAPLEAVTLIQDCLDPQWKNLIKTMLLAVEYGWASCELVWGLNGVGQFTLERAKPLLHELTEILVTAENGRYAGLRNTGEELEPSKCLIYTYDGEAGDFYGRSRYENIRVRVWNPWTELEQKWRQYIGKAAGIIPIVEYPTGVSYDANGTEQDNSKMALALLNELGKGAGVAMPREFAPWAESMVAKGQVDAATIASWNIKFLEAQSGHGAEFIEMFRYYDALMCRGFLTPERTIVEGQHGTLAEAEAHTDVALSVSDDILGEIVDEINRQIVDTILEANFGKEARGKVRACAAPVVDDERVFVRQIMSAVLTNPANADLFMATLDIDAMLDEASLPKARETIGPLPLPTPVPAPVPGALPKTTPPAPGPLTAAMRQVYRTPRLNRLFGNGILTARGKA